MLSNDMKAIKIHLPGFEKTTHGEELELWALENDNGMIATFSNFGPSLTTLFVPDRNNIPTNIALGRNSITAYEQIRSLGRICVGQYAGPLAQAQYTQPDDTNPYIPMGQIVHLTADRPPHITHGGEDTWMSRIWRVDKPTITDTTVSMHFHLHDPHMGIHGKGFPGEISASIQVTLTNQNRLQFVYTATTDRTAPIKLTNHAYFNLNGIDIPSSVANHIMQSNITTYFETDSESIPTGNILPTSQTLYDFSLPTALMQNFSQVSLDICAINPSDTKGYVEVYSPTTGIKMNVTSDQPCVQIYNGSHLKDPCIPFEGLCIEPGQPPSYIHYPQWHEQYGPAFTKSNQVYLLQTEYAFSTVVT